MSNILTFFNCREEGYIRTRCEKPKKAQSGGEDIVFFGAGIIASNNLIRGMCFINDIHVIAIIDTGATHSLSPWIVLRG